MIKVCSYCGIKVNGDIKLNNHVYDNHRREWYLENIAVNNKQIAMLEEQNAKYLKRLEVFENS